MYHLCVKKKQDDNKPRASDSTRPRNNNHIQFDELGDHMRSSTAPSKLETASMNSYMQIYLSKKDAKDGKSRPSSKEHYKKILIPLATQLKLQKEAANSQGPKDIIIVKHLEPEHKVVASRPQSGISEASEDSVISSYASDFMKRKGIQDSQPDYPFREERYSRTSSRQGPEESKYHDFSHLHSLLSKTNTEAALETELAELDRKHRHSIDRISLLSIPKKEHNRSNTHSSHSNNIDKGVNKTEHQHTRVASAPVKSPYSSATATPNKEWYDNVESSGLDFPPMPDDLNMRIDKDQFSLTPIYEGAEMVKAGQPYLADSRSIQTNTYEEDVGSDGSDSEHGFESDVTEEEEENDEPVKPLKSTEKRLKDQEVQAMRTPPNKMTRAWFDISTQTQSNNSRPMTKQGYVQPNDYFMGNTLLDPNMSYNWDPYNPNAMVDYSYQQGYPPMYPTYDYNQTMGMVNSNEYLIQQDFEAAQPIAAQAREATKQQSSKTVKPLQKEKNTSRVTKQKAQPWSNSNLKSVVKGNDLPPVRIHPPADSTNSRKVKFIPQPGIQALKKKPMGEFRKLYNSTDVEDDKPRGLNKLPKHQTPLPPIAQPQWNEHDYYQQQQVDPCASSSYGYYDGNGNEYDTSVYPAHMLNASFYHPQPLQWAPPLNPNRFNEFNGKSYVWTGFT